MYEDAEDTDEQRALISIEFFVEEEELQPENDRRVSGATIWPRG